MEQRTIQTQESAERIDALLARSLPGLTRSAAQRLLAQGAVTKDGAPVKKNYKTVPGDTFVVTLPDAAPSELVAQDLPLDVVYEDADPHMPLQSSGGQAFSPSNKAITGISSFL